MRVLWAGLWAGRGLNLAAFAVTVFALLATVLAPLYGRAAGEHLLDSRLAERPAYETGLSLAIPAMTDQELPDDPDGFTPVAPQELVRRAAGVVDGPGDDRSVDRSVDRYGVDRYGVDRYWAAEHPWLLDEGGQLRHNGTLFTVPLYWRAGMCRLAEVAGRCPTAPGEALVQARTARVLGVVPGDRLRLHIQEKYLTMVRFSDRVEPTEAVRRRTVEMTVVGTYRVPDPDARTWFDSSRFVGLENLEPPPEGVASAATPRAPALLVAPASMRSQTFVGGVDRPVDTAAVDLDDLPAVERAANRFVQRSLDTPRPSQDLALSSIFDTLRAEQSLMSRILVAALVPLVVLALLLLYALMAANAEVRRPYVALAKLRGHSRGRVLRFALAEPFLVVLLAVPVAVVLGWVGAHLVARAWLGASTPVRPDPAAVAGLVAVALAALAASTVAAWGVVHEPLSRGLASSVRTARPGRVGLVLRSAVVAVAAVAVAQILTSGSQSQQLLALLTPVLVSLALAVAGAALLKTVSRWWVRRTAVAGGASSYLAARRLARRPDLANLLVPLLLAVSVIGFAASAGAVSDDWRVSRARAEVGAAATFVADASPGRLLELTRRLDPEGRHLAAAVVDNSGDGAERRLLVDTTRMAAVAAWDPSWSTSPVAELQRRLRPQAERIAFRGARLTITVRDVRLRASGGPPRLWLQYVDDHGEQRDVVLGTLRNVPRAELTAEVGDCARRCLVEQLYLAADGHAVSDAQGELTVLRAEVDGRAAHWGFDEGRWRPARPFPVSLIDPPVRLSPRDTGGLTVDVFLRRLPPGNGPQPAMVAGFARITPDSTPDVLPVVTTRDADLPPVPRHGTGLALEYPPGVVVATALNGQQVPARVAGRTAALPVLGRDGSMADLETSLVEFESPPGAVTVVELWTAPGTPEPLLQAVRDAGITLTPLATLDSTLEGLRTDAFSVGLRLFLIVGVATLLLAVFGVLASAVLQSRWRSYEVASLRVVGVSQRSLVRASVGEHGAMLGFAVLLGLASAWLSLRLVLPSISLGPADEHDPVPAYAVHWPILAVVGAVLFLVAAGIALLVSVRTTRMGRPANLRWAEQG